MKYVLTILVIIAIEKQGVKDDDEIQFIDIPGYDEKIRCKPVVVFLKDRPTWEITQ